MCYVKPCGRVHAKNRRCKGCRAQDAAFAGELFDMLMTVEMDEYFCYVLMFM